MIKIILIIFLCTSPVFAENPDEYVNYSKEQIEYIIQIRKHMEQSGIHAQDVETQKSSFFGNIYDKIRGK